MIEIEISTSQEAHISKGVRHITTKDPGKGMQGTLGHHKILRRSKIMVLLELVKEEILCQWIILPEGGIIIREIEGIQCLVIKEITTKDKEETLILKGKEISHQEHRRIMHPLSRGILE